MLAGLAIGRLRGGRMSNLAHVTPRWLPLFVLAVAMVTAARSAALPAGLARTLVVGGYGLAVCGLAANLGLPWLRPALAGAVLNTAVIAANGGRMPVAPGVLREAAGRVILGGTTGPFYVLTGPRTALPFLGDLLPLAAGGVGVILSPGDVLLVLGIAGTVQAAMVRPAGGEETRRE